MIDCRPECYKALLLLLSVTASCLAKIVKKMHWFFHFCIMYLEWKWETIICLALCLFDEIWQFAYRTKSFRWVASFMSTCHAKREKNETKVCHSQSFLQNFLTQKWEERNCMPRILLKHFFHNGEDYSFLLDEHYAGYCWEPWDHHFKIVSSMSFFVLVTCEFLQVPCLFRSMM